MKIAKTKVIILHAVKNLSARTDYLKARFNNASTCMSRGQKLKKLSTLNLNMLTMTCNYSGPQKENYGLMKCKNFIRNRRRLVFFVDSRKQPQNYRLFHQLSKGYYVFLILWHHIPFIVDVVHHFAHRSLLRRLEVNIVKNLIVAIVFD